MQTTPQSDSDRSSSTYLSDIDLVDCRSSARHVIFHPDITEVISEDGVTWTDLPVGPIYLTGFVGGEIIGVFIIEKKCRVTADVHVQVLPKWRETHAIPFGLTVIDWTWENTEYLKMVAEIPEIYPNVMDFAERMGFEIEGVNCKSYLKGGKLLDQVYYGLCRGD